MALYSDNDSGRFPGGVRNTVKWWYNGSMQVFLAILSVGLLGLIIYFAVSPKSSGLLRLAALIALGLIAISIGVCAIFLVRGPTEATDVIPLPFLPPDADPQPERKGDLPVIIGFLVLLLVLVGLIYYSSKKEKERKALKAKEPAPARAYKPAPEKKEEPDPNNINFDDDTFEI